MLLFQKNLKQTLKIHAEGLKNKWENKIESPVNCTFVLNYFNIKAFQFGGEYIDVLINAIGLISHMEKYKIKFIIHTLYKNKFQVD